MGMVGGQGGGEDWILGWACRVSWEGSLYFLRAPLDPDHILSEAVQSDV